jgi:hypothetical protein
MEIVRDESMKRTTFYNPTFDVLERGMMVRHVDPEEGDQIVENVDTASQTVFVRCFVGGTWECVVERKAEDLATAWITDHENYESLMGLMGDFTSALEDLAEKQKEVLG